MRDRKILIVACVFTVTASAAMARPADFAPLHRHYAGNVYYLANECYAVSATDSNQAAKPLADKTISTIRPRYLTRKIYIPEK